MKTKSLPKYISNPFLMKVLKSRVFVFLSYWIFQGFLYMNIYEKLFKVLFNIVGISIIAVFFSTIFSMNKWFLLLVSFVITHTLNMLFNGHIFSLGRFLGYTNVAKEKYLRYIAQMRKRWLSRSCFKFIVAYGSLSREELSATSDLDIRVFAKSRLLDVIGCCFFVFVERTHALFAGFPIDIYVIAKSSETAKIRSDEIPVILLSKYDPNKFFETYKSLKDN